MELNKNQFDASRFLDGHCMVVAGPGSGKTRVVIERILFLLSKNIPPEEILVFSFTVKACEEIKKRIMNTLGYLPKANITTFHSFCYQHLLMLFPKDVQKKMRPITEKESIRIIKDILVKNGIKDTAQEVLKYFKAIRNQYDIELPSDVRLRNIKLYDEYEEYCRNHYYIDYDDMLYLFYKELSNDDFKMMIATSYKYLLVDESQDTNKVQFEIISALASISNNMYLVGDPQQSIYQWRGTDSNLIVEYMKGYDTKSFSLSENYRSDGYIVDTTSLLIRENQNNIVLEPIAMRPRINKPEFHDFRTDADEAKFVVNKIQEFKNKGFKYGQISIEVRTHNDAKAVEIELKKCNVPYHKDGKSFFTKEEIETIISYYELIIDSNDDQALLTICDKPSRGLQMKKALSLSSNKSISIYECLREMNDKASKAFIDMIEDLKSNINKMSAGDYFEYLLDKTKILEYREFKKEEVRDNLNIFKSMIENINDEDMVLAYSNFLKNIILNKPEVKLEDEVRIITIHQAKGLEFDIVFLIGMKVQTQHQGNFSAEEVRIWYVGATRAKDYLFCSYYKMSQYSNKTFKISPYFKALSKGSVVIHHA